MIVLTVLGRPDCHLCEAMIAELTPLVAGRAQIEVVDISDDETLALRYLFEIPVLKYGDEELSRHRLDRDRLAEFFARRSL
jgi:hypothetical protein